MEWTFCAILHCVGTGHPNMHKQIQSNKVVQLSLFFSDKKETQLLVTSISRLSQPITSPWGMCICMFQIDALECIRPKSVRED